MSVLSGILVAAVLFTILWQMLDKIGHPFFVGLIGVGIMGIMFLVIFKMEDYRDYREKKRHQLK